MASHLDLFAQMASWPFISIWRVRFNVSAAPVASTAYPIVFCAFDNVLAVRIDLQLRVASWPGFST